MFKRVLSIILVAAIMATFIPEPARVYADSNTWTDEEHGIVFTYEETAGGEIAISKIKPLDPNAENGSLDLILPEEIDGRRVTELLGFSNDMSAKIKSIAFNSGIKAIPANWGAGPLVTSITFPANSELTAIYDSAFRSASSLTSIALPDSLLVIGANVFTNCLNLTSVTLGNSLVSIGDSAFGGVPITSIAFPDSLQTIGANAFLYAGQLTTVTFGSGLETIGASAFRGTGISSIVLPNSLNTIGVDAFRDCGNLTDVSWPQGNAMFDTVRGFYGSSALKDSVISEIPSTVSVIDDNAFMGCHFTEVVIPRTIARIGANAFSKNQYLERITITESNVPLTIGPDAFAECINMQNNDYPVVLPERVTTLYEGSLRFWTQPGTFEIYNPYIEILDDPNYTTDRSITGDGVTMADPWYNTDFTAIHYTDALTSETSPTFWTYKSIRENNPGSYPFEFRAMGTEVKYTVSGTVPEGATIKINVNGVAQTPELTGQSFSLEAIAGSNVSVMIILDGYQNLTYNKASSEFTSDWDLGTITVDDFVPTVNIGSLDIVAIGQSGVGANIAVFDSTGKLVVNGNAGNSGSFTAQELVAGEYTVVAFEKNAYVSGISSIDSLETLGITEYASATATVIGGESTEVELTVPKISHAEYSDILDSIGTFVTLDRTTITKNMDFYGKVYYKMAEGSEASKIKIVIPDGLELTSVTSERKKYTPASVYSGNIVTITGLTGEEIESGVIYIGLKAPSDGTYCLSASVESSAGVTAPAGSCDFKVGHISLELKEDIISNRTVSLVVWAEPSREIKIRIGNNDETVLGTTNKLGYISTTVELPSNAVPGASYPIIVKVIDGDGTHTDMGSVYYTQSETSVSDFYFVHGNKKYDLVKDGINKSGGFYTYVADGKEQTRYWTVGATLTNTSALTGGVIVGIQMMDGSFRNELLTPVEEEILANGSVKTRFVATIYIESGGYHEFDDSRIPEGFDLDYTRNEDPTFVTDEGYMNYLEELVGALEEERRNNMDPAIIQSWNEEEIDIFFHDTIWTQTNEPGYHFSSRDDLADEFAQLSPEMQDLVRNVESNLDAFFDAWQTVMGDEKPMYEYESIDDYYQENWWSYEVVQGDQLYTVDQYVEMGYTPSDDGNYLYLYNSDPSDPYNNDCNEMIIYNDDHTQAEHITIVKDFNKIESVDKDQKDLDWNNLKLAQWQLDSYFSAFNDEMERLGLEGTRTAKRMKVMGTFMSAVGAAMNLYEINEASHEYIEGLEETEKFTLQYDDLHNQVKWAEHDYGSDRITMDCLKALRAEEMAAYELMRAGDRRDTTQATAMYLSAGTTLAGGLLMLCAVAPPVGFALSVGFLAADLTGFHAVNMSNNDVAAAKAALDKAHLKSKYECADEATKAKYRIKGIFDPSGFVYEAIEENRLEGVKATVVDDGTLAVWDAAAYDQINPQITDADGNFAWDVPAGIWKVQFEKDGYDDTETEGLEVPPPRMNLKIPMVSKATPEVESVNVYTDYIEVIFTQYMKTGAASEILGSINGTSATEYNWQDEVENPSGDKLSKVVRIPTPAGTKIGDKLDIEIASAKNYADKAMAAPYTENNAEVTHRPTEIILNYESLIAMRVLEGKNIAVRIKDEEGNYMEGVSVTASVSNEYLAEILANGTTDGEGKAVVSASALLPGLTDITFKVPGTTLEKTLDLKIATEPMRTARINAEIAGNTFGAGSPKENYITVDDGSVLTITVPMDGAKIYYTLDDTCPCQNSASRREYTGPITVTDDMRIRIAAYKDGLDYSERTNLNITVKHPSQATEATLTFDLGEGVLDGKTGKVVINCNVGEEIEIIGAPSREGYTFTYWKGSEYYPGQKYTVTGDHTFVAQWKKDSVPEDKSNENKPDEEKSSEDKSGDKESSGTTPSGQTPSDGSGNGSAAPKSGDYSNMGLWVGLLLLAAVIFIWVIVKKREE